MAENENRGGGRGGDKNALIVSSAHLAEGGVGELSELEFGLTIANNAFQRWVVRCMAASGYPDLSALDVLVLHSINHRARSKKLADICLVLNIEDTHTVAYALKKLAKLGLIEGQKKGKENFFSISVEGRTACDIYRRVREQCLLDSVATFGQGQQDLHAVAGVLRVLSGLYDQAARAAASM